MPKKKEAKSLTPQKAIRHKCICCCAGSHTEVRLCPAESCSLWEYRLGKRPEHPKLTPVRAIKARCRDCCGETWADVRACPGKKLADGVCPLFDFREGTNPNISAETRAAARRRAEIAFLGEKRGRSPLVRASEDDGRVFVHPGDVDAQNMPPLSPSGMGGGLRAQ